MAIKKGFYMFPILIYFENRCQFNKGPVTPSCFKELVKILSDFEDVYMKMEWHPLLFILDLYILQC